MGVIDLVRGRDDSKAVRGLNYEVPKHEAATPDITSSSDSDTLSLEARNEKEVQLHPDQVTRDASMGVQKAEAVALVWSKKAVWATYAW